MVVTTKPKPKRQMDSWQAMRRLVVPYLADTGRMADGSETIVKILVKDEIYPSRFGMFLALGNIQHVI